MIFSGIDHDELQRVLAAGIDHNGDVIERYTVHDDGWTMRCCLTDSAPGDRVAMIAWSPMPWPELSAELVFVELAG